MLNFLWFLFASRSDSRCGMFWFWDGRKYRRVDTLQTLMELYTLKDFDWDTDPDKVLATTSTEQVAAVGKIAGVVRTVFKVPEFDKGGLSNLGCCDVLTSFRIKLNDVKKNTSIWPISSVSPDSEQPPLDLPPDLPSANLDSTSISTGSPPEQHGLPAGPTPVVTRP